MPPSHSCVISPHFNGERLGEVGGRIVAGVLLGLLEGDPKSYRNVDPHWRPTLPGARAGEFTDGRSAHVHRFLTSPSYRGLNQPSGLYQTLTLRR